MATIFREPGFVRREVPPRNEAALAATDQGRLDNLLKNKDTFFSGPGNGPEYDYPNPRGKVFPQELRTWLGPLATNLLGKDKFFSAPGIGPVYDYPNPRGSPYPQELRTFTLPLMLGLITSALPGVQQHVPPNPTGKPFPQDLRGAVYDSPIQLIGQDKFFGDNGEVPTFDYPNPRGKPHPSELRTFANPTPLNLLGQDAFFSGPGVGPDYDFPNPTPAKPYPVALRTWTQSPSLFGRDQFFAAPGEAPRYDFPNPTLAKSAVAAQSAFAPTNILPLTTTVVLPATMAFDYPNPRGKTYPADLRTYTAPVANNLLGKDQFFAAAGQPPVYDFPNPTLRKLQAQAWQPVNNIVFNVVVLPATMTFDHQNPRGRVYPTDLRTFANATPLNLAGKDKFFGAPGEPPRYDFPNPQLRKMVQPPSAWGSNVNFILASGSTARSPLYSIILRSRTIQPA